MRVKIVDRLPAVRVGAEWRIDLTAATAVGPEGGVSVLDMPPTATIGDVRALAASRQTAAGWPAVTSVFEVFAVTTVQMGQQGHSQAPLPLTAVPGAADERALGSFDDVAFFHALEFFEQVPLDLYRTVETSEAPWRVASVVPNPWSLHVPLACATASRAKGEIDMACPMMCVVLEHGVVKVRGISLSAMHPTNPRDYRDPFGATLSPCSVGDRFFAELQGPLLGGAAVSATTAAAAASVAPVAAADGPGLVPGGGADPLLPQIGLAGYHASINAPRNIRHTQAKNNGVKTMSIYMCCRVRVFTNFGVWGMALVFDNANPGHFTLVPRLAGPHQAVTNGNGTWIFSDWSVCTRAPGLAPPVHPEYFAHYGCMAFPFAAQQFSVHCVQMRASAECAADLTRPDVDAVVFRAASLLHAVEHDDAADAAIQACTDAGFVLAEVPAAQLAALADRLGDFAGAEYPSPLTAAQLDDIDAACERLVAAAETVAAFAANTERRGQILLYAVDAAEAGEVVLTPVEPLLAAGATAAKTTTATMTTTTKTTKTAKTTTAAKSVSLTVTGAAGLPTVVQRRLSVAAGRDSAVLQALRLGARLELAPGAGVIVSMVDVPASLIAASWREFRQPAVQAVLLDYAEERLQAANPVPGPAFCYARPARLVEAAFVPATSGVAPGSTVHVQFFAVARPAPGEGGKPLAAIIDATTRSINTVLRHIDTAVDGLALPFGEACTLFANAVNGPITLAGTASYPFDSEAVVRAVAGAPEAQPAQSENTLVFVLLTRNTARAARMAHRVIDLLAGAQIAARRGSDHTVVLSSRPVLQLA